MRKAIILLVFSVIAISIFFSSCQNGNTSQSKTAIYENSDQMVEAAKAVISQVAVDELKKMYEGDGYIVLIDVRAKEEYVNGYIPGAVNIPRGTLEFQIGKEEAWDNFGLYIPEKTDTIVVYCRSGNRSALAAESLLKMGFANVKSLEGGWEAWHTANPELMEKIAVEETAGEATPAQKPASSAGGC